MVEKKLEARKPNILNIMAAKYNLDPEKFKSTIKATVMKPGRDGRVATDEEFMAFLMVANKYDLDPFTNEIYAYPSKKGGIIPVIGVDGYVRKICNHPEFNGMEIAFSDETTTPDGGKVCPEWCEVKLYRKGVERPIIVREYLDEVYRKTDYDSPWKTHTKRMLRHKTIIQAGRVAGFLVGVYDEDEAQRIIEAEISENKASKPETEAPKAIEQQAPEGQIYSVHTAMALAVGETFSVSGVLVTVKKEIVASNKKSITHYIIKDEADESVMMKIFQWGEPMEGVQQGDRLIFNKVKSTTYKEGVQYLAKSIEPDMREPEPTDATTEQ